MTCGVREFERRSRTLQTAFGLGLAYMDTYTRARDHGHSLTARMLHTSLQGYRLTGQRLDTQAPPSSPFPLAYTPRAREGPRLVTIATVCILYGQNKDGLAIAGRGE